MVAGASFTTAAGAPVTSAPYTSPGRAPVVYSLRAEASTLASLLILLALSLALENLWALVLSMAALALHGGP